MKRSPIGDGVVAASRLNQRLGLVFRMRLIGRVRWVEEELELESWNRNPTMIDKTSGLAVGIHYTELAQSRLENSVKTMISEEKFENL